jgi:phage baseplate assembly protein W|tara:strand:- start:1606 stop:2037 length:432 start_codon:yes stop_codon:yes gene_type:complete
MARPTKKINPLDLKKNVAIGIPFPLGGTPIFSSTFTTEEQALSNLKNLLLTRKGERPFQPLFGTDIPSFLFENITRELLDSLKAGLEKDIKFWLPYIKMEEIIIESLEDENRVNMTFSFSVGESGANQIIIVEVDNQGGLSIA